ncbi:DUF1775 domain-containing protein [Phenylobacterium sp.]|jgi:uncharacterized protein YcnI|uniref:DUF1775 domain-containing protein n=1 Tax=Phenylobacterium sp. TaxID=1871053 RepID=UPI002F42CBC1
MRRAMALAVAGGALALAAAPLAAQAHVTVWPRQSQLGAREAYVIRMPNEKKAATVRLDAEFPPEARVTSLRQAPGWRIEPKRDAAGAITGASWAGELPPDQYVEFGVQAVNPKAGATLTWKFVQTYADGTRVEWTGAPGTPTPAPQVRLLPVAPLP